MDDWFQNLTQEEYAQLAQPRIGKTNPEPIENKLWEWIVLNIGYITWPPSVEIPETFRHWGSWRHGMSRTLLKDNRIVFIGGAREDVHGFFQLNDVIVRDLDGNVNIFAYPMHEFPGISYHSATLVGEAIYIIGSTSDVIPGLTPIYVLELRYMSIRKLGEIYGEEPGPISHHQAMHWRDKRSILIWGGEILDENYKNSLPNLQMWSFSIPDKQWSRVDAAQFRETEESWDPLS